MVLLCLNLLAQTIGRQCQKQHICDPIKIYLQCSCIKHYRKDIYLKATQFYSNPENLRRVHCSGEKLCGEWRKPFAPPFFLLNSKFQIIFRSKNIAWRVWQVLNGCVEKAAGATLFIISFGHIFCCCTTETPAHGTHIWKQRCKQASGIKLNQYSPFQSGVLLSSVVFRGWDVKTIVFHLVIPGWPAAAEWRALNSRGSPHRPLVTVLSYSYTRHSILSRFQSRFC